ncbi:MAG: bestrophin family protein [Agriterribacter sp.]
MLLNGRISILYFIRLIRFDVMVIFLYAIIAGTLGNYSIFKNIVIPLSVTAMVGTLVSLLLAFKTSQSYERWWEARIVWGTIVNDSRTFIRELLQFLPAGEEKREIITRMAKRQAIWCYSLADSLRKVPFSEKVQTYLAEHKIESSNIPNRLLTEHSTEIAALSAKFNLNANVQIQLDTTLARLTDSMGRCERIKNTIFPKSYSLLIHFLIYVFLTIFPFGLDDFNRLTDILITIFIPILFIAIEQTAIVLQDPFENKPTDTPMTTLSATIEKNLSEMAGVECPNQPEASYGYYIM